MRIFGTAAAYDLVDRAGDVIRWGAFHGAMPVPLLHQHRGLHIGTIVSLHEKRDGLKMEAEIVDPGIAALVRQGALNGLSVGYRPRRTRQGARREVLLAELMEVSLVAVPMQSAARIERIVE